MLYSVVQQCESVVNIHISSLSRASLPPRHSHLPKLSQSTELPVRYSSTHQLFISHMVLYICQCYSRRRQWQPLQCSCLQNPRDGGAWWAAVYGVAQSRTRLKRLSISSSSATLSLHTSLSLLPLPHVHKSILCVSISIPVLQIGSSVAFFLDSTYMR